MRGDKIRTDRLVFKPRRQARDLAISRACRSCQRSVVKGALWSRHAHSFACTGNHELPVSNVEHQRRVQRSVPGIVPATTEKTPCHIARADDDRIDVHTSQQSNAEVQSPQNQ